MLRGVYTYSNEAVKQLLGYEVAEVVVETNGVPILAEDGGLLGYRGSGRNISELVGLMKAKDDFLASMSHELRTPLTSIIGNSEFLAESELTQAQREMNRSVVLSGKNLLSLVNDILDLSKLQSGKFEVDLVPYDLPMLLNELEMMFEGSAQDQGLTFNVHTAVKPQHQLWGDGKRIGQVLINLIGNAIKFTEHGAVSLKCRQEEDWRYFAVTDSGIGISGKQQQELFQPFQQAGGSISRKYGGTGLGLYLSQSLAQEMGGAIEVVSAIGKGSCFTLKVPYRESELLNRVSP